MQAGSSLGPRSHLSGSQTMYFGDTLVPPGSLCGPLVTLRLFVFGFWFVGLFFFEKICVGKWAFFKSAVLYF